MGRSWNSLGGGDVCVGGSRAREKGRGFVIRPSAGTPTRQSFFFLSFSKFPSEENVKVYVRLGYLGSAFWNPPSPLFLLVYSNIATNQKNIN